MGKPYDTASGCWCESSPTDFRTGKLTQKLPNPQQQVLQMNRRQFLCLLPAAAVAGTAVAAAPKSLSLEEGLLSAWRKSRFDWKRVTGFVIRTVNGEECRPLRLNNYLRSEIYLMWTIPKSELHELAIWFQIPSPVTQQDGWWTETEQGPMRLCPHSLRWFPYSPKTDAL
jgi:hypothetical protein